MKTLLLVAMLAAAPKAEEPSVQLLGDLPKTGKLTVAQLEALGPVTADWAMHGEKHTVFGVPLDKVLAGFGFTAGPMGKDVPKAQKRSGWKKAVLATAGDGFQALFSCAELAEEMGPTRALLVWKVDGKPLTAEDGPFRLVVLTDKEGSRSVFGLQKLEVLNLAR